LELIGKLFVLQQVKANGALVGAVTVPWRM